MAVHALAVAAFAALGTSAAVLIHDDIRRALPVIRRALTYSVP